MSRCRWLPEWAKRLEFVKRIEAAIFRKQLEEAAGGPTNR